MAGKKNSLHRRAVSIHRDNVNLQRGIVILRRGVGKQRCGIGCLHRDIAISRLFNVSSQCRLRSNEPTTNTSLAMESEITLTGQAPDKKWEYRVIAVNNAGQGEPSNTVMAVL